MSRVLSDVSIVLSHICVMIILTAGWHSGCWHYPSPGSPLQRLLAGQIDSTLVNYQARGQINVGQILVMSVYGWFEPDAIAACDPVVLGPSYQKPRDELCDDI